MPRAFHFISGLPRSGSTLLAGLLRQNPRFHAAMSGPVATLVLALQRQMSGENDTSVFIDDAKRRAVLRGVFDSYYADIPPAELAFDTNRLWCSKMPLLADLHPGAKVIACVRQMPWIMDSFERLEGDSFGRDPGRNPKGPQPQRRADGMSARIATAARAAVGGVSLQRLGHARAATPRSQTRARFRTARGRSANT